MFKAFRRCPAPLRWRLAHSTSPIVNVQSLQSRATLSQQLESVIISQTVRTFHKSPWRSQQAAALQQHDNDSQPRSDQRPDPASELPKATKFAELAERKLVDKRIIDTITRGMGLETMTEVQSLTLNEALKSKDVLAQAKTGTGKTIAFLLPLMQNIVTEDPTLLQRQMYRRRSAYNSRASDVRAIIISPTRELAEQIAVEAKRLTYGTGVMVQTAVGGTQKRMHLRKMQTEGCHILVGTPGRLKDILSDTISGVSAPNLTALVLDEADRLLDQGFWPEIQAIQELLPTAREKDRQTLMFSATVPRDVVQLARSTMKPDLHYVRTVDQDAEPTHERVKQRLVVVPSFENSLPAVLELCDREIKVANARIQEWMRTPQRDESKRPKPFKAIVYHNATAETSLNSSLLIQLRLNERRAPEEKVVFGNTRVFEIHSRLTQAARTTASDLFRQSDSGILMSSDVTARGMDFPNVTHVIQMGLPQERDTYIHRIGRTARAGAEGEGWLVLPAPTLNEARIRLGRLPLERDSSLETASVDFLGNRNKTAGPEMTEHARKYFDLLKEAAQLLPPNRQTFDDAYMGLIGTLQWFRNKEKLFEMLNSLAAVQWGLSEPPAISPTLASKLGLRRVPGVNIGSGRHNSDDGFGQPSRGGYGDRNSRPGGFGARSGGNGDRNGRNERNQSDPFGDANDAFNAPRRNSYGGNRRGNNTFGDRVGRGGSDRQDRGRYSSF